MIRHHPDDARLLAVAAGSLARGPAVVIAAHAERCARCRARLREFEALGGALLEQLEPAALGPDALTRTLARIDAADEPEPARPLAPEGTESRMRAALPAGVSWPRSLRGSAATRWLRLGPNVRWSRVTLAGERAANVYLLRVAPGRSLPVHSHRGGELTLVLHGAFHAGGERFGVGDVDQADDRIQHQPVATTESDCICLISIEGRVAFDGPMARVLGSLLRM